MAERLGRVRILAKGSKRNNSSHGLMNPLPAAPDTSSRSRVHAQAHALLSSSGFSSVGTPSSALAFISSQIQAHMLTRTAD